MALAANEQGVIFPYFSSVDQRFPAHYIRCSSKLLMKCCCHSNNSEYISNRTRHDGFVYRSINTHALIKETKISLKIV